MMIQEHISYDEWEEFIKSINWMCDNDPRLNVSQIARMMGMSAGHFHKILKGESPTSRDIYDKWFDEFERPLRVRIASYIPYSDQDLKGYINKFLPAETNYICQEMKITPDKLKRLMYAGRRQNLLNVYDVLTGKTKLIPDKEPTKEITSQEDDLRNETIKVLNNLKRLHIPIKDTSYYVTREESLYSRLIRKPDLHFQQATFQKLLDTLPTLKELNDEIKALSENEIKVRVSMDNLVMMTMMTPEQLQAFVKNKLGAAGYLQTSKGDRTELLKNLSQSKALLLVAVIRLEERKTH